MRRIWQIALACAACAAAPLAHGQSHAATASAATPSPTVHRTISPMGRVMAALLQQGTIRPQRAAARDAAPADVAPRTPTTTVQPAPVTGSATAAHDADEVAVQPHG